MRHNYPAEFENLWAGNAATTRKEAGYAVYLRMKKKQEEDKLEKPAQVQVAKPNIPGDGYENN
jgi:hypothetical protein